MKKLRVLVSFRDENNFFLLHEVGSVIMISPDRAARLVEGGLCEVIEEPVRVRKSAPAEPAEEKKEAPVVENEQEQPVKRQNRKRKY